MRSALLRVAGPDGADSQQLRRVQQPPCLLEPGVQLSGLPARQVALIEQDTVERQASRYEPQARQHGDDHQGGGGGPAGRPLPQSLQPADRPALDRHAFLKAAQVLPQLASAVVAASG